MKQCRAFFKGVVVFVLFFFVGAVCPVLAQDVRGSGDHPLLARISGFYISQFDKRDFDSFQFVTGEDISRTIDGKKYEIIYELEKGKTAPGEKKIVRHYANALIRTGGQVIYQRNNYATARLVRDGAETWVTIDADGNGEIYRLVVVEKEKATDVIFSDAPDMARTIEKTGKVALYGIVFDTGKALIDEASEPELAQIAKLLRNKPGLRLHVVGHTDNDGLFESNMALSRQRAETVVRHLVSKYQIEEQRLRAHGVASLSPLASNKTLAGKARNRRVELIEQ